MRAIPYLALLTAGALLMIGCSGPAESVRAEPAGGQSPSIAASTKDRVSLASTCLDLFGEGSNSLANESAQFLVDVESLDADTAKTANSFNTRLGEAAATAKPELAEPLEALQVIFQDFAQAWEDSGDWSLDTKSYAAAKDTVVRICGPEMDALEATQKLAAPTPSSEISDEESFLKSVRAAHPAMKSSDTNTLVDVARNFCLIYDTGAANGKESTAISTVNELITAAAGIDYTLEELKSIHHFAVTTFCTQHMDKLS